MYNLYPCLISPPTECALSAACVKVQIYQRTSSLLISLKGRTTGGRAALSSAALYHRPSAPHP